MPLALWHPLALLSLIAVAAVAAAALRRCRPRAVAVSSLKLWEQAAKSAGVAGGRRLRRPSVSWWLLLAGAVAAALALARPVWTAQAARRTVAIVVVPSAELANPPGMDRLRQAARTLLARLDGADRVALILPAALGGQGEDLLTPGQTAARIEALRPAPIAAEALTFGPVDRTVQRTYRFAPASLGPVGGADTIDIPLPTSTPPLTLDALAAEPLAGGAVQVLAAVRNHSDQPRQATLRVAPDSAGAAESTVTVPPGGRRAVAVDLPGQPRRIEVALGAAVGEQAVLLAQRRPKVRVALAGRPNAFIQRFAQAMEGIEPVEAVADADAVLAVGTDLADGKPGVVFDGPGAPPGWRTADEPIGPLALAQAGILADHPLLRDVELADVVVRLARPLLSVDGPSAGVPLVSMDGAALILADESARRLHIGIDPAPSNTHWGMDESFPLLLANAIDWIAGPSGHLAYRLDESAGVVGLTGSDAPPPDISLLPLPSPRPGPIHHEFWPGLTALAGLAWVAGWVAQAKEGRQAR